MVPKLGMQPGELVAQVGSLVEECEDFEDELVHRARPGLAGGRFDELAEPSRGGGILVAQESGAELLGDRRRQERSHALVHLRAAQASGQIGRFGAYGVHGAYLGLNGPGQRRPRATMTAAPTDRNTTVGPPDRTTGVGMGASLRTAGRSRQSLRTVPAAAVWAAPRRFPRSCRMVVGRRRVGQSRCARNGRPDGAIGYAAPVRAGSLRIFRIAGIDVYVHVSWLVIFALVTWSLAVGYYPPLLPDLTAAQAWTLGAISAILLFASVLVHELAHSLAARTRGMQAASITLFIFGGISSLTSDAPRASTEFLVAIVGPLTSLLLAGACFLVAAVVGDPRVVALFGYLALINALLGGFNLIPGFPLDGGRVLRAVVWQLTGSMRRGLEVAVGAGQLVGYVFMVLGVLLVLGGNAFNGIWIAVIGWFLQGAGAAQLRQVRSEERLTGVSVRDVMRPDTTAIAPNASVEDLIEAYLVPGNRRAVPVVAGDRLVGMVTLGDIQAIAPQARASTRVVDVMGGRSGVTTVGPDTPLAAALEAMLAGDFEQLPVLEDGRLMGVLSRADIIRQIQLREALHLE